MSNGAPVKGTVDKKSNDRRLPVSRYLLSRSLGGKFMNLKRMQRYLFDRLRYSSLHRCDFVLGPVPRQNRLPS